MNEMDRLFGGMRTPVSRRELLRRAGRGSVYMGAMALLAACGVQGQRREEQQLEPLPPKSGELVMANWPLYIDKAGSRSPTVDSFEKQFDVEMKYDVTINDNEEFFGTIREPLSRGQPIGWDIIVLTDWMIARMVRLGYLERLHHEELPNFEANAAAKFKDPYYDPGNEHSIPWAAGITGIGYDVSLTGRDLTSVNDLFDPAFFGRVGLFLEMRDTFGLVLASMGIPEPEATVDDVREAQGILLQNRDKIRGFYGNDYADQLATGNLAATMAWSGDVFALQLDNPNLRFVIPDEGGMRWTDNMAIPTGAEHPTDAHLFMNHVYEPRIAANITEWVWYESPVEAVEAIVLEDASKASGSEKEFLVGLGDSPLVFPTIETTARTYQYKNLEPDEEEVWSELWQEVIQG